MLETLTRTQANARDLLDMWHALEADAFHHGIDAHGDHETLSDNPYDVKRYPALSKSWYDGWKYAEEHAGR